VRWQLAAAAAADIALPPLLPLLLLLLPLLWASHNCCGSITHLDSTPRAL
jgi:hypothetical protein